ncbi:Cyclic AMP-dependent transcription factor ATF-3 [Mactra antiquata]
MINSTNLDAMFSVDDIDEAKLHIAALEAYSTGNITPILKEELKYYIQSRRLSEGKNELVVDFNQNTHIKKETILRPDEIERLERRKAQNRRASAKFRMKKKSEIERLEQTCADLQTRNKELSDEIKHLTEERNKFYQILGISVPSDNN